MPTGHVANESCLECRSQTLSPRCHIQNLYFPKVPRWFNNAWWPLDKSDVVSQVWSPPICSHEINLVTATRKKRPQRANLYVVGVDLANLSFQLYAHTCGWVYKMPSCLPSGSWSRTVECHWPHNLVVYSLFRRGCLSFTHKWVHTSYNVYLLYTRSSFTNPST